MATLQAIRAGDMPGLLALNNAHAEELSLLTTAEFARLVNTAYLAIRATTAAAFLLAFDQDTDYASPNFLWMRERFDRFVYIDRIAVAAEARGRGLARQLYAAVFATAARAGHVRVVCEVNREPPNPTSDAFHRAMGFVEIGSADTMDGGKSVRYFARAIDTADDTAAVSSLPAAREA
ncbi:GNAT family N-acetyltransferase [Aurantimonas aggregata]|uniref:GNAT family N-acetyltransferase n=1 Tax=Aurantimonas aggregata TaxID=2047720 RepID=A0A6L9MKG6_9HYPH|nr:GNAT family N-acetyltransferase [Aurantimonas aggregata]NDV88048.1 GNAT family N-acetyltransferase [Aurantimonas aggregata]